MPAMYRSGLAAIALIGLAPSASADVVADWNERAVAFVVARKLPPPPAERILAMTHAAMFDAVNSIERKYRPYVIQLPADPGASKEVAAAAAAASVLASLQPDMKAALRDYLQSIPDGTAKTAAIQLGEAVAMKVLEARRNDGAVAPDSYRTHTPPGVYVPTAATWAPHWPGVKPFVLSSAAQFRPAPPIALASQDWTDDYNEIKVLGRIDSKARTPEQSEVARFWLTVSSDVYYPVIRTVAASRKLSVIDGARLYALAALARADSFLAVFDAKYHYGFWRPVSAIRHGDNDGNPATDRDPAWRPLDETPMHPEYPCAHCIQAAAMCAVLEAVLGTADVDIALTSPTAPGVTRRWTNLRALVKEVSDARIWAGLHYRFSTRVAEDMGHRIADHVVKNALQPVAVAAR